MSGKTATLNDEQRAVKAELADRIVLLEKELDSLIKMFTFARESLENEMLSGLGYAQKGLDDKFTRKLKELTIGMNSVVESKIRYDKAKKALAANMTPQEEMAAVVAYIVNLSNEERKALRDMLDYRGIYKWKS